MKPVRHNAAWVATTCLACVVSPVQGDALVVTRAMTASTVAEIFIDEDAVRVELEIGVTDLEAFVNLVPDELLERMGRDPETSVLNEWNQAWDVPNLFITDGACMTSSANQNPSLTYMALTARAAAHAVEMVANGEL